MLNDEKVQDGSTWFKIKKGHLEPIERLTGVGFEVVRFKMFKMYVTSYVITLIFYILYTI